MLLPAECVEVLARSVGDGGLNEAGRRCAVVTPVLNGIDTLPTLLASLLDQDLNDAVVWYVIDDGSDDGTLAWLGSCSGQLPNLKLVVGNTPSPRSGPGLARNVGIASLRDERWVTFVDADDALEPGALGSWVSTAERLDVDVLLTPPPRDVRGRVAARLPLNECRFDRSAVWDGETLRSWGVYGKLYRRDFLSRSEITFPNAYEAEDAAFYIRTALAASSIGMAASTVPRYRYAHPTRASLAHAVDDIGPSVQVLLSALDELRAEAGSSENFDRGASPVLAGLGALMLRGLAHDGSLDWHTEPLAGLRSRLLDVFSAGVLHAHALVRRDVPVIATAALSAVLPTRASRAVARVYVRSRLRAHERTGGSDDARARRPSLSSAFRSARRPRQVPGARRGTAD